MTGDQWRQMRQNAGVQPHDLGLDPVTVWRIEQRAKVRRVHCLALERACQLVQADWQTRLSDIGIM